MKAYCKYMQYDFNPEDQGTNIRKIETKDEHGYPKSTSAEHIFIGTESSPLTEMKDDLLNLKIEPNADDPFNQ